MNRNPLAGVALATTLTLGAAAPAGAALTFTFEYRDVNVGFNDPAQGAIRRQALEETAALLSGLFPGLTANITLEVDGSETRDGTLAAAGSRLRPDCIIGFGDRGIVGVKALGGEDINGATADGTVTVNFEDVIWDFDDTIDIPNAFDFKSTMLHELLHAMGFANSLVEADGRDSCGRRPPSQGGFRPFDDFLGDTSQDVISASGVVDAARWARIRVGGTGSAGTLWRGDNARALNNGDPVPMYSPTSFSQGSSISHVDTDFYTQQEILMEHATTPGPGARTLTGIEVGILRDIGFTSVGTSGGGGGTGNRICANPNAAIPDNNTAGLISPLNVTLAGNISDLNVSINASHTFVGDLTFSLTQVSTGRTVRLINRPGSGGCGGDSIAVTLDDSAAANADDTCSNAPALSGSLRPTEPLSQFNGSELSGEWRLAFADNAAADTGLLSQWCLIPETSGTGGGGGDTGAAPSNRIVTPFLPIDPSQACPGFYVAEVRGNNADGRYGLRVDLDPNGNKLLQGGINLGGRFGVVGNPGFAAFSISNPAGEAQVVDVQLAVNKPANMAYDYLLTQRFADGSSAFILGGREFGSTVNLSQVVNPGFYVFELASVGANATAADFAVSLGTRFTNRAGGAFDGGVNIGGVVEGPSVGFASFCVSQAQSVRLETLGDGTYPGAFPGGAADLGILVKNGVTGEVIIRVP